MDLHNLTANEKQTLRKQFLRFDFPYSIGISLGEFVCNQRCKFCPQSVSPPTEQKFMRKNVFKRACEVVGNREVSLEISAYGETYQHPEADDFLEMGRRMCPNANIIVASNGTLLSPERCERIVNSGIDIFQFSLDTGSAESHGRFTGTKNYDGLCRNLEQLIETREKNKAKHLKIYTHIIGIKELEHEFEMFVEKWAPKVDLAHVREFSNWAGRLLENSPITKLTDISHEERYPCTWLWYASKIQPTGDVTKCYLHSLLPYEPLGNIMTRDLEEIWSEQMIQNLRQKHLNEQWNGLTFCRQCDVWYNFPKIWTKKSGKWE